MLFYPAIILAIIISIANLLLSFHVVPAYVQRAEAAIKADVKQILFRNIQRQGFYSIPGGRFKIYADAADLKNSALLGVIIVDDNPKREKKLITAEAATINFESTPKKNEVKIFAKNAYQVDSLGGVFFKAVSILGEFGNLLSDDVKFRKIDQINAIKLQPITYPPIAECAYNAYEQLTIELLNNEISKALKAEQLYQMSSDNVTVRFKAEKSVLNLSNGTIELLGKAELYEYGKSTGELEKNFHGEKIILQLSGETETRPSKKILLIFPNAVWLDRGVEFIKPRYSAKDLYLPEAVAAKLGDDVMATAAGNRLENPSAKLNDLIKEMHRKTNVTFREIKAEIHSRLVFGIGCITLILIGTELGIRFRGGHLLTAFGISSIPAAALLIFIMMGKNIMKNQKSIAGADMGVVLMWSGLGLLTIISLMLYRKLLRN